MFIEKEETHYETLLCFGAVVILTAFLFRKALQFGFVSFDDALHTYRNAKLTGLSWTSVLELWKAPFQNLFIPVTYSMWATIALIASRVGQPLESSASLFHLANWLLHALNAGTVCLILLRLEKNRQAAVVGALFFAFHPLQVEPVAWISALKDTLSVFFSLVLIFFGVLRKLKADDDI